MMPAKEKVLVAIVLAVVGGKAATDRTYRPVPLPTTSAPTDVPALPEPAPPFARSARTDKRSMFEIYSNLKSPDPVELPEVPAAAVPVATPPVRPFPHLDAARNLRHLLFDPAAAEEVLDSSGNPVGQGEFVPDPEAPKKVEVGTEADKAKPPDLSQFDWVRLRVEGGLAAGPTLYGKIDLLARDREAGKTRFDLLVDDSMEFLFNRVDDKSGKYLGGPIPFRERTEALGFADTADNKYWTRRKQMERAAGHATLELTTLRELGAWSLGEAEKPRYLKRRWWALAADTYREVIRRNTDDKDTLKDLGRVYRLLQDLDGEASLYSWWIGRGAAGRDEEILALQGEAYDLLGLPERAMACWTEALRTAHDPRVRLRLAEALLSTGGLEDARKAAEAFRRAAQEGERAAGVTGEARALIATGDSAGAKAVLSKVAAESEKDAGWYNAMGAILYAADDLEGARGHFQAAVDRAPPASMAMGISRTNLALAKARLAGLLPEGDETRKRLLDEALRHADDALKDDPFNYYWPLVARGYALRLSGKPEKAVESLQEAVAALPGEAYGRTLLGEFLLRDGRRMEGRTHLLEATRLSPGYPDALGGVGRAGGGEPGEAKDYLRRASGLEPKTAQWPLLGARAVLSDEALPLKQRLEDARRDLTYLLSEVDRNSYVALAALGWVRYYQGDAEEALGNWDKAQRLVNAAKPSSAKEAALVEEFKAWLAAAKAKVDKWLHTRIWRDEFRRAKGTNVGNGWIEEEKNVKWTVEEDGAHLGPGRIGQGEVPTLLRKWDSKVVLKVEVTVVVAPEEPEQVDVRIWMPQGKNRLMEIGIRKTEAGEARLLLKADQKTKDTEMIREIPGFAWPKDGRVTFGFVKVDETTGKVALRLNGGVIPGFESLEVQALGRGKGGELRVQIECTAQSGTEVRAKVEAVEVWQDTHGQ